MPKGNENPRRGRSPRSKHSINKNVQNPGRRRLIFKQKPPMKAPIAVSTPLTSDTLWYKGSYFSVGDVVSVVDDKWRVYYAQIRGLLQDQYCEKSAVLTWLLPTQNSPRDRFDPTTYIIGPEEEIPRKLECLEFVMHAPSDYYQARNSPYPTVPLKPESGFIWTRLGEPKIVKLPYDSNSSDND